MADLEAPPRPAPRRTLRRRLSRVAAALAGLLALFCLFLVVDGWTAFGKRASGARRARMEASPEWDDGVFENPQPLWNDVWGSVSGAFQASAYGSPSETPPIVRPSPRLYETAPASGLRVTWLGHSTTLIEIEGTRVLTDPIFGERSSPFTWMGPRRFFPPPIALDALPPIDVVLISHDHYDHLDLPTIEAMRDWDVTFVAPLGVGAHLEYWGIDPARIVELDWWQTTHVGALEIVSTPARHASGRTLLDQNATLWSSYALLGADHRVYFSGDTGLFPALREIGERYGPFDLAMIEVGAYDRAWPDWHLGPEQAVRANGWVRGQLLLPIHWGLFDLAYHGWTEPIERTLAAADAADTPMVTPRAGQAFEPADPPARERWWPRVPWQTAQQHPVVARGFPIVE
ncbi:MAG: MBL fold metallo-hydrolase [Sandaracinaceae bacterium]|nr:MBL fold metallo-hydrolase [Sandaracinaceae bacterium]